MATIFVSYPASATATARALVRELLPHVEPVRVVFEDQQTGASNLSVIREQLASADVVVVVIDRGSWTMAETLLALEVSNYVAPVLVGGASSNDLPDDLRSLARRQGAVIRDRWFADDVAHFARQLKPILARLPSTPSMTFRGAPFREPLPGNGARLMWGSWADVDGRSLLATGDADGRVQVWDPVAGTEVGSRPAGGKTSGWGAWGNAGGQPVLATAGSRSQIQVWDPFANVVLIDPGSEGLPSARWGSWGTVEGRSILAVGSGNGLAVQFWDLTDGLALKDPITIRRSHSWAQDWGAWLRLDGRSVLATGGWLGGITFWDAATGHPAGDPLEFDQGAGWASFAIMEGRPVVATGKVGTGAVFQVQDLVTRTTKSTVRQSTQWATWGDRNGVPVIATQSGAWSTSVQLWDPTTGEPIGPPLTGHTGSVSWGAWCRIDEHSILATGSSDATRLWDPVTGMPLGEPLTGPKGGSNWGVWHEVDGRPVLATAGDDGMVWLWEVVRDKPVARLPQYRSDTTGASDALDRAGDAQALAELITARSAQPPLAVGLFGDWGEGKSHFLDLVREHVRRTARADNPLAHDAVRQVWFNAWHYAETDLWASLVAELFAQLAQPDTPTDRATQQREQSRLMAEVIADRGLAERLQAARARRDELRAALDRAERDTTKSWTALTGDQQQELRVVAGDRAEHVYGAAIRTGAVLAETGQSGWRLIRGLPRKTVLKATVLPLVFLTLTVAALLLVPGIARWVAALPGVVWIAGVVAGMRTLRSTAVRELGPIWQKAVEIARSVQQAGETQRGRLRTAADVAAAEVAALEQQRQNLTAAGQLAGFVSSRAADGDYRSHLGVMTQIREDFQRMAALLAGTRDRPRDLVDVVGDPLPRIDRIILYIDDLDRCPPHRVVAVLEAIHLLLAVDLFVVVVAVDPRWLLQAIAAHYQDLVQTPDAARAAAPTAAIDPDDEELWRSTPAQYLEKIFQVVLTLPPLDTHGYQQMLRTLVGTRPDEEQPAPTSLEKTQETVDHTPARPTTHQTEPEADDDTSTFGVSLPAARVVERLDPLTLEADELTLLDLLGPATLITTPRATKRLANSYGLLTALRRDHRADDLAAHDGTLDDEPVVYHPYRSGLVLLGALIAFPALGPALLTHLHRAAAQEPNQPWTTFLTTLQPTLTDDRWSSPADPDMTAVQAQQWRMLLHGLGHIQRAADKHDLPLPAPLHAWADWIVPVGRLSFPAGRVVNTLRHFDA